MNKENLFGKTLYELQELFAGQNYPAYTARQTAEWMYKKKQYSFDSMTNISKKIRQQLKDLYCIQVHTFSKVETSADGTKKYLFHSSSNNYYETAFIPEKKRNTLCISVQVGCKMNCSFCMTGKQGFQNNLSSGEIISQIFNIPENETITNIVYMGMGEPLDNLEEVYKSYEIITSGYGPEFSNKKITISTIGITPKIQTFIEKFNCNLAISIHTPFSGERKQIMPVEKKYPVAGIINLLKKYKYDKTRRITFEYIMFRNMNDTPKHANELSRILHGLKCRVNLIRYHTIQESALQPSDDQTIQVFREKLNNKGITTTVRTSRGTDISAACGLLSTKEYIKAV